MFNMKEKKDYNAREIALHLFAKAAKNNNINNINKEIDNNQNISNNKDKPFIINIVEGTYKNQILINFFIDYLIKKSNDLPEIIKNILKISFYQIEFMDSVPDSAVTNEAVKLAKKYGHKGTANLVNAVIRNFLRKKNEIYESIEQLPFNEKISIKYSYPLWIIDYWLEFLPENKIESIAKAMYQKAPLFIRINTLKISLEEYKNMLVENKIDFEETEVKEIIKLKESINIQNLYGYNEGYFYVQDLSAAKVITFLQPDKDDYIIDFCAFPGGKTSYISQLMNNNGNILALDISEKRKERFLENINRLGCENIEIIIQSAEQKLSVTNQADKILVDPPCSGLGVIKRKSDIKYIRSYEDINRLAELQLCILENASEYLKINGILIYSTCTISKIENEAIIEKFLGKNTNFVLEFIDHNKYLNIYPDEKNSDGFFIAKLKRIL